MSIAECDEKDMVALFLQQKTSASSNGRTFPKLACFFHYNSTEIEMQFRHQIHKTSWQFFFFFEDCCRIGNVWADQYGSVPLSQTRLQWELRYQDNLNSYNSIFSFLHSPTISIAITLYNSQQLLRVSQAKIPLIETRYFENKLD